MVAHIVAGGFATLIHTHCPGLEKGTSDSSIDAGSSVSQSRLASLQVMPVRPGERHIGITFPVAMDPVYCVSIGHLIGVDALALERHLVLFVVASAVGGAGEADEYGNCVLR